MARDTEDKAARREETEHERLTRNVSELLQELRVAQAGVQFLFGFLLAVAFTEPYARASGFQQFAHVVAVIFAVAATALLSAPAAWHRMLFRQGERPKIIEVANRHAIAGMVCLAVAMTFTVLLLLSAVLALWAAIAVAVLAAVLFAMLWFVLPLRRRWGNGGSS
jgi:predicted membrane channel-forming protein YqfA (hemolysin III family)